MWSRGRLVSRVRAGAEQAGAKFADYFEFDEPFPALPSHRILAMMRGEREQVLELTLDPADDGRQAAPVVSERAAHDGDGARLHT